MNAGINNYFTSFGVPFPQIHRNQSTKCIWEWFCVPECISGFFVFKAIGYQSYFITQVKLVLEWKLINSKEQIC